MASVRTCFPLPPAWFYFCVRELIHVRRYLQSQNVYAPDDASSTSGKPLYTLPPPTQHALYALSLCAVALYALVSSALTCQGCRKNFS